MAKIVEVESDISVGTPGATVEEKPQSEQQLTQTFSGVMKRAYVLGMSTGIKMICSTILSQMNDNKRLNPQKQLILLRELCYKNLAQQDKYDAYRKEQQTNNLENNDKKENE